MTQPGSKNFKLTSFCQVSPLPAGGPWLCNGCGENQVAFRLLTRTCPCHVCHDAQRRGFPEADAGIPERSPSTWPAGWAWR